MMMSLYSTKLPHQLNQARTFIAARIKWVCDPYLDTAVSKEKDLKQVISMKNQLISSPSKSLPLSSLSLLKPYFNLSTTALNFFHKYYTVFSQFQPSPSLPFHIKLSPQAISLHKEEQLILKSQPLHYPEYFNVCEDKDCLTNKDTFFLELVSWKDELAVSEMEKRVSLEDLRNVKRGERIGFPLNFPNGFDLKKKVRDWVFEWQGLPYISPYENAFHLNPNGDQAEKWTVTVLHELLWLLVSKKTEKENVLQLGDYLGFGNRFNKALVHHPGIFYVSNKIRTQTVVLREAYRKGFLVHKHLLMGMRFRYIRLMSKAKKKRRKSVGGVSHSQLQRQVSSTKKGIERKAKYKSREEEEERSNDSSESEFEDVGSSDSSLEDANNKGTMKMKMKQARALSNKAKALDLITRGRLLVDISGWNLGGCLQLLGGESSSICMVCGSFTGSISFSKGLDSGHHHGPTLDFGSESTNCPTKSQCYKMKSI
ncbi:hypothetical protein NC651_011902 [Populus alba x Populus x berolinensis]|nr:hypothetical protein NC651_011902 [Populus alba x Populus x berolinensis]